jgi:hypothetical protein
MSKVAEKGNLKMGLGFQMKLNLNFSHDPAQIFSIFSIAMYRSMEGVEHMFVMEMLSHHSAKE